MKEEAELSEGRAEREKRTLLEREMSKETRRRKGNMTEEEGGGIAEAEGRRKERGREPRPRNAALLVDSEVVLRTTLAL